MYEAIVFKIENGLPVSSRMIRFSPSWHRLEVIAHCKFVFGKDAYISVRRRKARLA